jgi:hypothetical protein
MLLKTSKLKTMKIFLGQNGLIPRKACFSHKTVERKVSVSKRNLIFELQKISTVLIF